MINEHMRTSEKGIEFNKQWEALRLKAYFCPAGVPTIGYGHTKTVLRSMVIRGHTIDEAEAERLLAKDLAESEYYVEKYSKVALNQNQYDALVSFCHNCGPGALQKVIAYLNKYGADSVPARLMLYIKHKDPKTGKRIVSRGLLRRRRAECAMWREIPEDLPEENQEMPQEVLPESGSIKETVQRSKTIWLVLVAIMSTIGQYLSDAFSFASAVISETQNKLTATDSLFNLLSGNAKTIFLVLAVMAGTGVVLRRLQDAKEKKRE